LITSNKFTLVVILLFFLPQSRGEVKTSDLKCAQAEISLVKNKTKETSQEIVCFDSARRALISENCYRGSSCKILDLASKASPKLTQKLNGPIGSPNIRLCHEIDGFPEIIDLKWKTQTYRLSRCIFQKDKSYIDTESLFLMVQKNKK